MMLVDTPIWSIALRRPAHRLSATEQRHLGEWIRLVRRRDAGMIGVVQQELLSGIGEWPVFERLRLALRAFPSEPLEREDFDEAARCHNTCRAAGIAGSMADYLLCAVALRLDAPIYTTDRDFERYAAHLPLRLHNPAS